jgi:hypothetical protein
LEGECLSIGEGLGSNTEQSGALGPVQVEATGVIALSDSHGDHRHACQAFGVQPEPFLPPDGIEILVDG